jgi:hypothetical protein
VPVPGEALDRSMGSGPAGDPRSLNPLEAPERLHDLFNREGAISHCNLAWGEEPHHSASSVERCSVQEIPPLAAGKLGFP